MSMIEEKQDPIDRFFKENFEEVEVQYNAAHWAQLQHAMVASAAAGSSMAALPQGTWMKLLKLLRLNKIVVLFFAVVVVTAAIVLLNNFRLTTSEENDASDADFEQVIEVPMNSPSKATTSIQESNEPGKLDQPSITLLPDTNLQPMVMKEDSIDSLKVDTTKVFIFW